MYVSVDYDDYGDEEDDGFFVDVTDIEIKKSNPAVRTLSVSGPIRVQKHNHIQGNFQLVYLLLYTNSVDIPRHTSMSAAVRPAVVGVGKKRKENQNDSGISVAPLDNSTSLSIKPLSVKLPSSLVIR